MKETTVSKENRKACIAAVLYALAVTAASWAFFGMMEFLGDNIANDLSKFGLLVLAIIEVIAYGFVRIRLRRFASFWVVLSITYFVLYVGLQFIILHRFHGWDAFGYSLLMGLLVRAEFLLLAVDLFLTGIRYGIARWRSRRNRNSDES